jgi:small-conductance mechanosensitive channel
MTNYSHHKEKVAEYHISISFTTDVQRVKEIILDQLGKSKYVLDHEKTFV